MLSTTANVVVAAPLPIASVATATAVRSGRASSERRAYLPSRRVVVSELIIRLPTHLQIECIRQIVRSQALWSDT